jgi:hypothetical protein
VQERVEALQFVHEFVGGVVHGSTLVRARRTGWDRDPDDPTVEVIARCRTRRGFSRRARR